MKRTFIMVLDSFGIGATEDAECFGDVGIDILGRIAGVCVEGEVGNGRKGLLNLPNLTRLRLAKAHEGLTDFIPTGMDGNTEITGACAWVHEMSSGKDTPPGHWEITGVPILFEQGYFSDHGNSLPQELLDKLAERANLPSYLGNRHFLGTAILDQLSEERMRTGKSILYTSADSVFQIACHEETFGLDKLYKLYKITHGELTNSGYNTGRVITRPFIGGKTSSSQRAGNRHDLAVELPAPTVLQKLADEKHGQVVSIGKTTNIYANCGTAKEVKAANLDALFDATIKEMKEAGDNTIIFTNFVDFDSPWGHHHDVVGCVTGLRLFDRRLPELMSLLRNDDTLTLTAGHGCDPAWVGIDHTRKHIPVLAYGPKVEPGSLGHRETFVDIGQTLAEYSSTSDMEYSKAMS